MPLAEVTSVDVLELAQSYLFEEENWTRGSMALDATGHPVLYQSDGAKRFCISGALNRSMYDYGLPHRASQTSDALWAVHEALLEMRQLRVYQNTLPDFNDAADTKHEDVMFLFSSAIAKAGLWLARGYR